MEAAPRLPMISLELKVSTEPVQFGPKLKQYISTFYHEDPESYSNEINCLETLRSAVVRGRTPDVSVCATLKRYYCQLHFLKARFPMSGGGAAAVAFSWRDPYTGHQRSAPDIELEQAAVLYNIGALHTQLGAADSRVSSDGMRMACTHFQCAAWCFQQLGEEPGAERHPPEVALHQFMHQLCLAQAQECILEKSMMDNRKSTIIAKVAAQVVEYYRLATYTLQEVHAAAAASEWSRYLRFKVAYHGCVSLLYQGQQSEEQQKMGERVAFYQAASELLEDARRQAGAAAAGSARAQVEEALAFTQDVVEGKRKAARNENEFIYHETVPERDGLPQLRGASLVKAVPFSAADPDVSGADIFGRLVPMEAHEASSVYSERKADMLRRLGAVVESRDAELHEFVSSLQLDELADAEPPDGGDEGAAAAVPQEVVDRAAALSARPRAAQALVEAMGRLSSVCQDVEHLLAEAAELLEAEQRDEREYSGGGARPPSMVLTDLGREAAKYREAHARANESNQALHRAMSAHVSNLRVLAQPLAAVAAHIPAAAARDLPPEDRARMARVRQLLDKVDEMRAQRALLVRELRDAVRSDDITGRLVTLGAAASREQLYERELSKHRGRAALVEQNMSAQDNVLRALTAAYADFAGARRQLAEGRRRREQVVAALVASYDAYDDLLAKANKGIDFYQKLETNVTKLLQRVRSACRVRQEEREQMLGGGGGQRRERKQSPPPLPAAPKLRDYLNTVRPAPLGSEETTACGVGKHQDHRRPKTAAFDESGGRACPLPGGVVPQAYPQQQPPPPPPAAAPGYESPGYASVDYTAPGYYASGNQQQPPPSQYAAQRVAQVPQPYASAAANVHQLPPPSQYAVAASAVRHQVPQPYAPAATNVHQQPLPGQYASAASAIHREAHAPQQPYGGYVAPTGQQQQPSPNQYVPAATALHQQTQLPRPYAYAAGPNVYQQPPPQGQYSPAVSVVHPQTQVPQPYAYVGPGVHQQPPPNQYASAVQQMQVPHPYGAAAGHQQPPPTNYASVSPMPQRYMPATSPPSQYVSATPAVHQQAQLPQTYMHASPAGGHHQQPPPSQYAPAASAVHQQQPPAPQVPVAHASPAAPSANQRPNVPAARQPIPGQACTERSAPAVSSNVDLLAGLDFSVSQVPLDPTPAPAPLPPTQSTGATDAAVAEPRRSPTPEPLPPPQEQIDEARRRFSIDVDRLSRWLELLCVRSLGGPTPLDVKWRELQGAAPERDASPSISVARCYPAKNRSADVLPYDRSRVRLATARDDYINASHMAGVSARCPPLVVTQAPLPGTVADFWTMVRETQAEVVACLLGDDELAGCRYWDVDDVAVLSSRAASDHCTERVLSVSGGERGAGRCTVVHLQFRGRAAAAAELAAYAREVYACASTQRCRSAPTVVHCLTGEGRSGVLCVLLAAAAEMAGPEPRLLDVQAAAASLNRQRRGCLADRDHLRLAYEAVWQLAVGPATPGPAAQHSTLPIAAPAVSDPLSDLDPLWKLSSSS